MYSSASSVTKTAPFPAPTGSCIGGQLIPEPGEIKDVATGKIFNARPQ